jgi:acetyltransferase
MTRYNDLRTREMGEIRTFTDVDREKAGAIIQGAKNAGREHLSAEDVFSLLSAYNIPAAKCRLVANSSEALEAGKEIGFPVVIKADAESIVHKSDVGGVALDVGEDEIVQTVEDMGKKLAADNPRFLVQQYMSGGREIIIGAKAEQGLGHLIMFGIGGIHVEILKDVAFGITPLTLNEADELLSSIKSSRLLSDYRGEKGVCRVGLVEMIQRVSQLVTDLPMIQEMDLNPIFAYENDLWVVDARIRI